jgi:hypothetical protein
MPQRVAQEGFQKNPASLSDIFSSGGELVAQISLRIPISKRAKPSRSIEV